MHWVERGERVLQDQLDLAGVADFRRAAAGAGLPLEQHWPEVGMTSWASSRARVDLPEPLSPTTAVTRAGGSASDTSSTACTDRRPVHCEVLGQAAGLEHRRGPSGPPPGQGPVSARR